MFAGSGAFAALTALGISPRASLLAMLVVPVGTVAIFFLVLRPSRRYQRPSSSPVPLLSGDSGERLAVPSLCGDSVNEEREELLGDVLSSGQRMMTCGEKLASVRFLLKYMVPLGLVYFFEYLINQVRYVIKH
jgi:battenin